MRSPETELSRRERLARKMGWAHGPYRTIDLPTPTGEYQNKNGSGIGRVLPEGVIPQPQTVGGAQVFNNPGDAPPGTTTSWGGGPVNELGDVLLIFWGSYWNTPGLSPGVGDITAAVLNLSERATGDYGTYSYLDGLTGYGLSDDPQFTFEVVAPPLIVNTNPPNNPFSQTDVGQEVIALYNTPNLGGGADNVIWNLMVVFVEPGYPCSGAPAAHSFDTINGSLVNYAYVAYESTLSSIMIAFSHELVEALTDPNGDAVQVNPRNTGSWNEICDVCASTGTYNGVAVSSYFSGTQGACMIPSPPPPPLPPGDYRIDSIRKEPGKDYIEWVSGPGTTATGGRWTLAEYEVVRMIQGKAATFYTKVNGMRADVGVEKWYLHSADDGYEPNNLRNLPEF